ncbi:MAG: hypothetical protein ACRC9M_12295, partial [Aeromonas sp.]
AKSIAWRIQYSSFLLWLSVSMIAAGFMLMPLDNGRYANLLPTLIAQPLRKNRAVIMPNLPCWPKSHLTGTLLHNTILHNKGAISISLIKKELRHLIQIIRLLFVS